MSAPSKFLGELVSPMLTSDAVCTALPLPAPPHDQDQSRRLRWARRLLMLGRPTECSVACMQALQPLFSAEEEPGTRDNAAGAVSRMILSLGTHLPLEQVRSSCCLHSCDGTMGLRLRPAAIPQSACLCLILAD